MPVKESAREFIILGLDPGLERFDKNALVIAGVEKENA